MKKIIFLSLFILSSFANAQSVPPVDPSNHTTRTTPEIMNDGVGNKGGNICPIATSAQGYDCDSNNCLTPENSNKGQPATSRTE